MKKRVYIGLGSNIGEKAKNLEKALDEINLINGIKIDGVSSLYSTSPWGKTDQEDFVNQVVRITTSIGPIELLHILQKIEIKMGRQRKEKWGPRIIDLDILLYGDEVIDSAELKIPHPYMRERLFVLIPLQEIDAEIIFPDDGTTLEEVLVRDKARDGNEKIRRM